ncbi:hypothetical protein EXIGLDRAFT_721112 [Exidia glandulosa HHB12029]|uniref:F-box domain-containing protein n=1 Tax=Exidia glandulosa HHB12029 TaxID=1314781 RepID=A0A165FXL8_EXIGL|nr:hypothetical protein EXIGLDRAFT_721112 [Exidia glandulosa HHB12029]
MRPRATFTDLPVELSEFIILLAVHSRALDDNRTCASLTRTSRAIHVLVQPSVADTVFVNSKNRARVCATTDTFTSTRRLVVDSDLAPEEQSLRSLVWSTPAFHSVEMFQGPLWMLHSLLDFCTPVYVVATAPGWFIDSISQAPKSGPSRITHLSGPYSTSFIHEYLPGWVWNFGSLTQLSHLVIGDGRDDIEPRTIMRMLPKLLALPTLEYLCVCVSRLWHNGMSELLAFAQARNETRLWASREADDCLGLSEDPPVIGERLLQRDRD